MVATLKRGLNNSFEVIKELGKVLVPVIFLVTFLEHSGVLYILADYASPLMRLFGLPGEAALVLVIGNLTNVYGAIGAILNLELTARQITIVSVMVTISHSLPSETAIVTKAGAHGRWVLIYRVVASIIFGLFLNLVL
ncbi:nucleoside recognition domain-containing protein [Natranaerofaba carboxydovora]|uniref:nucleoside recognition domain-containing protein n=1 Tax=Natranaerofaba carboxydovora TaxID=2742683 RepID=UPI001F142A36|nr:nucleoside recognition domain-containing protein [Natranaerofaba carboxydovora]UMZ74665.1 Nucleoside recognition [Natranaerofaba carboxydovora]